MSHFNHRDTIPATPKPSLVGSSPIETPPVTSSPYIYLKPENIDYHCLHKILSALSDSLYDIYYKYKSVKKIWAALEEDYGLDDARIERFASSSFNKFMTTDNKSFNDQLHEF